MSLYKYMSAAGAIRLFRSGMLRFTQPIEFNDPFEMQPFLKGLADKPTLENQFHSNFAKNLDPQIDDMLTKTNLTSQRFNPFASAQSAVSSFYANEPEGHRRNQ